MVHLGYNFSTRTIRDVNKLLINGGTTVKKLHEESSRLINETEKLNPFITVCHEESLRKAHELDKILCQPNHPKGPINNPLFGVPISIKDNFCTDRILTTCASKMLHNFVPNYTATAVTKLLDADCLMMGKTNMDEFAMGSSSLSSFYGPTANTWKSDNLKFKLTSSLSSKTNTTRQDWFMAGGSSTGSAISVASGACFVSLGTDTGGSTRQPGSLTGVVGFKPTYGLISRFGLIPLSHCLDVVSILARCIDDVKITFERLVGQDEHDLTTVDHKSEFKTKFKPSLDSNSVKIRVGIPDSFIAKGKITKDTSDGFEEILKRLAHCSDFKGININFEVKKLDLTYSRFATECYTVISSAEIASNMSCYDGVKFGHSVDLDRSKDFNRDEFFKANRNEGFGLEVKKRILQGNYFLLSENREQYLVQALKLRRSIDNEFQKSFKDLDIIMVPSTPSPSVSYQEWSQKQADNELFHEDYFLIPSNLANLPSISIPYGYSSHGLPMGLQLIANKFHDLDLLFVSEIFQHVFSR